MNDAANHWDERYRSGEHITTEPLAFVVSMEPWIASVISGRRALDLASGPGRHALFLARCGWEVTAIDVSQVALDLLRREALRNSLPVTIVEQDLEAEGACLPADGYDLVLDCNFLHRPLLTAIKGTVRPGGIFLAVMPAEDEDPETPPMNPKYLIRPGELESWFAEWKVWRSTMSKRDAGRRRMCEFVVQRPPAVASLPWE